MHLIVVSDGLPCDRVNTPLLEEFCAEVQVFQATPRADCGFGQGTAGGLFRHRCPAATGRAGELLARNEVDLVHLEGLELMQHVPAWNELPVLLVEQNIEAVRCSLLECDAVVECCRTASRLRVRSPEALTAAYLDLLNMGSGEWRSRQLA